MPRAPFAYIRRSSKSKSDPGDISREFQAEAVRRLSGHDDALVLLDGDWGKSAATDETDKRLDFLRLMELVERGQVSTIYAYSTDRLARSVQWAARLLDACERAGTSIVTSEGTFAPGDDMARTMFQFQAITNEGYSRQAKRKRAATLEQQRARGTKLGAPFYGALPGESLAIVLQTFARVGSVNGTAAELNRVGLRARRTKWGTTTVARILQREGLIAPNGVKGAKPRADHIFYRLLRCHCGRTMTASRRSGGSTAYRCLRGEADVEHGRKFVAETGILEWAQREMSRLRPPLTPIVMADIDQERHALTARLERIRVAFLAGLLDEPAMRAEKAAVDDELTRLDLAGRAVRIPTFVWDDDARQTNLDLRVLWSHVELDRHLRPVRAGWLVPAAWLAPRASE